MNNGTPTFSLVVNTTDRASPLRTLLRTLEHQSWPYFEVIVVVGPTEDDTEEVLAAYEGRVHVLTCPSANLGQSRNIGLRAARGDIVAFIDDDAVPCRRWFEQLARLFENDSLDGTGGSVYLIDPHQPMVQHRLGIISSLAEQQDVCASRLDPAEPPGEGRQWVRRMMGTNMAFRREALLAVGGFDEFFEWVFDDADIALRLVQAGYRVAPVLEAPVYHVPASSRNRVAHSYNVKWWFQTKAAVYVAIKHGRAAGDPLSSILLRCGHLIHGHWKWSKELWREDKLTFGQFARMRAFEVSGGMQAMMSGFFRPRRLLSTMEHQGGDGKPPIRIFPDDSPDKQAAVDPIHGHRSTISMPDPPLRICLLSSNYPPAQQEGVGRLTQLMAQGLFERGHTVHVVTHGAQDRISYRDGAYVHEIPYKLERYDRYRSWPNLYHSLNYCHTVHEKVKRLILNDGIQIVDSPLWQFDGLVTAVSGALPVVVRLVTALRQIARIHGEDNPDSRLIGEMERALLARAAHLLPNTRATLDTVSRVYGLDLDTPDGSPPWTIVPYGIVPVPEEKVRPFPLPAQKASPAGDVSHSRRERHEANGGKGMTVLYVGRLEKRKGILDLFEAIPRVLAQVPGARFVIAGADNSQHDGFQARTGFDYPTSFRQRYAGASKRVEFLGFVDEATLQGLYQHCDLFVAPSLFESFGLIYLEAMNYGKPVVACRAGGVPEVVEDGATGLLVDPANPAALAETITSLLSSPVRLHDMGLAGRARLLERFTYLQMARGFEAVYRRVIAQRESLTGVESQP